MMNYYLFIFFNSKSLALAVISDDDDPIDSISDHLQLRKM